jgi:simple sugar transport system substrate-binding protein
MARPQVAAMLAWHLRMAHRQWKNAHRPDGRPLSGAARARVYREHVMNLDNISRRRLLQGTAALSLGTALPLNRALAKDTTIGFIYVGSRDDYGYNQAHAAGAAALKKMPGIKVVEEEKVPETDAVEKTMESMINLDGATLLFPTSFGYYNPHMLKMAVKYPKLRFEHCGGLWTSKDPKNAGSYFGYIDESQHVAGIVAGYMSKSGKLGFVAAKPIPQVLRNINAWTLGAKLANPKITTQVIFTGDWSMPVKEAEATNSLCDQGVDVITCHVDGPKTVVENAARRGAMVTGYHVNQSVLAPKAYLTGAEWNWEVLYPRFAKMFVAGETIPNFYRGGLKEDIVKVSPYGSMVSAEAKTKADEVKAGLTAGTYVIFKGPIVDNKGKTVIAAGVSQGQTDPELEKMGYLVDGVIGATS